MSMLMATGIFIGFKTKMASWFNLIVGNRIIHTETNYLSGGTQLPKIFNNDGNHGHDVCLYYFIIAF